VGVPGSGISGLGNASASDGNASWWLDTSKDFCVMKYPAKNNGSDVAVSTTAGEPWASITRDSSLTTCAAVGSNYRLISNTQWQTVARNAESVAANWSGNAVGSGKMARGHTDNSPANALANSTDDDPYFGTGNSGAAWNTLGATPARGTEQKRTQTLSNGEVVWDFAGNVWQWASDNYADLGLSPAIAEGWDEFSNTTNFPTASPTINRLLFAPLGLYTSAQNIGRMYGWSAGAVLRGGRWYDGTYAGLFSALLGYGASASYNSFGFRCAHPGFSPIDFADTSNGATLPGTTPNGANVDPIYFGPDAYSTSMATTGWWTAVGAIFSDSSNVNTENRPRKSPHSGSTLYNSASKGNTYVVIDLGQIRTFSRVLYYQMFSDGKTTHAAMDISTTLRGYDDAGWTPVHAEQLLANGDGTNPTTTADLIATFPPVTGRYVRLQLRNDGRYGSEGYVELFKVKIFE
jgi:formylglycine-generating enzyme required for sulfatase activity